MQEFNEKEKKKLARAAKVVDAGAIALLEEIDALEERLYAQESALAEKVRELFALISATQKEKGEKGARGEKGERGERGPKGDSVVGPAGRDGVDGTDGRDGKDGKDADEEAILTNLENKLPALGARVRDGLELLSGEDRLDASAIKNLPEATKQVITKAGWGAHPLVIQDEGVVKTKVARTINFKGDGVSVAQTAAGVTEVTVTGGGGSGITRSINVISTATNAGATAATDYVYLVSGTTTLTLPTAVGNTNRYTVKNVGVAVVTIDTTSAQTIDGTATVQIAAEDSVDIISDNSNWLII